MEVTVIVDGGGGIKQGVWKRLSAQDARSG